MIESPEAVLIGGGTGSSTLLHGIKELTPNLTALVNMSDDGGSSGDLRKEFDVLPPGDVRQCLVALAEAEQMRQIFEYRFPGNGPLGGHSLGNLILTALTGEEGSFEAALGISSDILGIRGRVLPATYDIHDLVMQDGGETIRGEYNISQRHFTTPRPDLWLEPAAKVNPAAEEAINNADLIVIAPGNLYGSILPIFAVDGLAQAVTDAKAQVVSVANLVTQPGQTDGWHVVDYTKAIESMIGKGRVDTVLYNEEPISEESLKRYAGKGSFPVDSNTERFEEINSRAIGLRLLARTIAAQDPNDRLQRGALVRHDPLAVNQALATLL